MVLELDYRAPILQKYETSTNYIDVNSYLYTPSTMLWWTVGDVQGCSDPDCLGERAGYLDFGSMGDQGKEEVEYNWCTRTVDLRVAILNAVHKKVSSYSSLAG